MSGPPPIGTVQVIPQISQETFDQVVVENIEEFEMDGEEALGDAVEQFKSQGVDLSNILIRIPGENGSDDKHPAMVKLDEYMKLLTNDSAETNVVIETCTELVTLMKDKAVRSLVAKNGGLAIVLAGCEKFVVPEENFDDLKIHSLNVLTSLVFEHPDTLGMVQQSCLEAASGETATPTPEIKRILALLEKTIDTTDAHALLIKAARFGCFMHESNRQAFVKGGLINICLSAAEEHSSHETVITQSMMTLRALTKDDDPRVPFGKGNEHASMIAKDNRGLERLMSVLTKCHEAENPNASIATELFKTLCQLANRDEFCKKIVDLGCLDYVLPALQVFGEDENVAHGGCTLLKAVAGNDEVKRIIGARGGISLIIDTMNKNLKSEKVIEQGAAALAAVTLKTPSNANAIAEADGAHVLVKVMYMHPKAAKLQRQVCMALRNMVVRNPELIDGVLGQGAESALNACLENHRATCGDEAKAALRDLKCKVELKELWTGAMRLNDREIDGSKRQD